MKKIFYFMTMALVALATSCDNDFAYPPVVMGDIKGQGTADDPYNVAKAIRVAAANGETSDEFVFIGGYVVSGSIDTSYGNGTWQISDVPGSSDLTLTVYRAKDFNGKKFTDANKVKVGDYIVVYSPLVNFKGNTPETTSAGYLYSINGVVGSDIPDQPSDPSTPSGAIYTGLTANIDGWTINNVSMNSALTYVWKWDADYKCLKASAYSGQAYDADCFITMPLDLSGYKTASAVFDHVYRYDDNAKTNLTFVAREQGKTDWTTLTIPNWPDGSNWTFISSGNVDLSAFAGKKVEMGFRYKSTTSAAATWEIKNFSVSATK